MKNEYKLNQENSNQVKKSNKDQASVEKNSGARDQKKENKKERGTSIRHQKND